MLKSMRDSAGSPFIKLLLIVLVLSFVSFYGFNQVRSGCHSGVIAEVNGDAISLNEYMISLKNTYEIYQRYGLMKGGNEEQMMKMLQDSVLSQLIDIRLKIQEARKLGLKVSDIELADSIKKQFSDPKTGKFSDLYYEYTLKQFGMTSDQYEESQRDRLLAMKLEDFIRNTAKISEEEVLESYRQKNEQIDITYVKLDPSAFRSKVTEINDEKLKPYFESNRDKFKSQPERKIEYIYVEPDNFIEATKDELKAYYDDTFSRNTGAELTQKRIRASHILLKSNTGQSDEDLLKQAHDIFNRLKKGAGFEDLAAKYNSDSTKYTGGDLGYFTKGKMVKAFEEAAFKMRAGEISKPVKTSFGYHIIKVTDVIEAGDATLERLEKQVKYEYLKSIKMDPEKSQAASQKVNLILSDIKEQVLKDPKLSLAGFKGKDNVKWGETGFIKSASSIEGLVDSAQVIRAAFGLLPGETSDIVSGFFTKIGYLVRVTEVKDAEIPKFEEVKSKIEKAFIEEESSKLAMTAANNILARSKDKPADFKKIVEKNNLTPIDTGKFKRDTKGRIPILGEAPEIMNKAFDLSSDKPFMENVIPVGENYYIVKLKEKITADMEKFASDKDSFIKIALDQRKNDILKEWIDSVKKEAKIKKFEADGERL